MLVADRQRRMPAYSHSRPGGSALHHVYQGAMNFVGRRAAQARAAWRSLPPAQRRTLVTQAKQTAGILAGGIPVASILDASQRAAEERALMQYGPHQLLPMYPPYVSEAIDALQSVTGVKRPPPKSGGRRRARAGGRSRRAAGVTMHVGARRVARDTRRGRRDFRRASGSGLLGMSYLKRLGREAL